MSGDVRQALRELHDDYVWRVNAAVGEGRPDVVSRLVEEYPDAALRLLTGAPGASCDRPGCAVCTGRRPAPRGAPPPGPRPGRLAAHPPRPQLSTRPAWRRAPVRRRRQAGS